MAQPPLEFRTQAQLADTDDDFIDIVFSDATGRETETFTVYMPTEAQVALLLAAFASDDGTKRIAAAFEFIEDIFGEEGKEDYVYLMKRLRDRKDPLQMKDLNDMILGIIEAQTGRPTQPSTGSTSSRRPGGRKLMDHQPPKAQTRSRSPRTASATSSTTGASVK